MKSDIDKIINGELEIDAKDLLTQLLQNQILNQQILSALMARIIKLEHQVNDDTLDNKELAQVHEKIMAQVVQYADAEFNDSLAKLTIRKR